MHAYPLITTIAAGFAAAWVFGLITQRLGLSPIVGYLLGGVLIGPHTPGFTADIDLAPQLAEIGVILLMFGVGLHFNLKDLLRVRGIAIPGAVGQSIVATAATLCLFLMLGWTVKESLILGMAMAVASTVVLLRGLIDRDLLNTPHGHVAVGWLIVEDIFTVMLLVIVPLFGARAVLAADPNDAVAVMEATGATGNVWLAIVLAMAKLAALVAIMIVVGRRVIPWALVQVAKLRSRELFTLTVLVFSIATAAGASALFGASPALGAFLAGMLVGQSPVSQQAASDALPMRDAFAVLFFVSVGMLFDPSFIMQQPLMVVAGLTIVLIAKPLAAMAIVTLLGYSVRTGLTVAIGLGQIGEFSFILATVALDHALLPESGYHTLVATAMISITLNPLLFASLDRIEAALRSKPRLWKFLNARADRTMRSQNEKCVAEIAASADDDKPLAVIIGYGPVGRVVDALLRDTGHETVVIDLNMDTIHALRSRGRKAIFGDGTSSDILADAGVARAKQLVVTLPHSSNRASLVLAARQMNPDIDIVVRARYLREREELAQAGVKSVVSEEGEAGIALARHVLHQRGIDQAKIDEMIAALRTLWSLPG